MKKFIVLLLVPFCLFGLMKKAKCASSDYEIIFEYTSFEMPVGGDIYEYLPEAYVYNNYTEEIDYLYGASYLSSITMIVPGLNRIVPSNILIYTYSIPAVDQHHLGGSFIGEAYANFGIFGFFPVVLLGNIVKEIDKIRIDENNELYACWIYMLEF